MQLEMSALRTQYFVNSSNAADAVQRAYQMAFARSPTEDETALGVEYLSKGEKALESYALALFGLHEFIYVD